MVLTALRAAFALACHRLRKTTQRQRRVRCSTTWQARRPDTEMLFLKINTVNILPYTDQGAGMSNLTGVASALQAEISNAKEGTASSAVRTSGVNQMVVLRDDATGSAPVGNTGANRNEARAHKTLPRSAGPGPWAGRGATASTACRNVSALPAHFVKSWQAPPLATRRLLQGHPGVGDRRLDDPAEPRGSQHGRTVPGRRSHDHDQERVAAK